MKTLVTIILALGVGFAAAYIIVSQQKDAQLEKLKAQPQVAAAPAPAPVEKVIMAAAPSAPAEESPQDILDDLLNVKLGVGDARNSALRMVVFKLESLSQRGGGAIPAIRSFLGKNVDVDYNVQDTQNQNDNQPNQPQANASDQNANNGNGANNDQNQNDNNGNGGNGGNNRRANRGGNNGGGQGGGFNLRGGARRARNIQNLQTDWVVPPSLRLGLVSTLKEIGGPDAEQALVEMLSSTARGVEVAYLTVVLEDMAPGKYRDDAIKAAKDLLMNPVSLDSPDQLDDLSKSYLYGVLEFYKDSSFAPNAEQMLVGPDGRLDQDAMDYLSTVLGDQSVSALYAAYNNSSLTNQFDKMRLGRDILNYVGQNSQANQLFTDTLNNPDVDSRLKIMSIAQLAGGGFGGGDMPDSQTTGQRIAYLQSIEGQYASDPQISQAINAAINSLQTGTPINPRDLFGGGQGGGGGGGGRRNRGGGGFGGGGNNGGDGGNGGEN